ncbi:Kinetochore-associated protein 1 [Boothiomyces macroporosus]|uniref:Kinetochore-associated protein 1 n=1 Tax=Boothiomyces macroporosus TaxID=261099 RepID=A0AAD5UN31_9FUNG|nr:Kinetochore-associated protein 1 [Boothiomyces macroporosus]
MLAEKDKLELDFRETELALKDVKDLAEAHGFIAASNHSKGAITCNDELFIVDLETHDVTTIQLDCPIEYIALSSNFLVIADSLGSLSFIDFNGNALHSIVLNNGDGKKFQGLFFNNEFELIVVFAGNLLKITTDSDVQNTGFTMDSVKHEMIKLNMEFVAVEKYNRGMVLIASGGNSCLKSDYLYNHRSFLIAKKLEITPKRLKKMDDYHVLCEFEDSTRILDTRGFKFHHHTKEREIMSLSDELFVVAREGILKLCQKLETDPQEVILQLLRSNPEMVEAYCLNNDISIDTLNKLKLAECPFEELVGILNEINDYEYLHSFCQNFESESAQELKTVYQFARNKFAILRQSDIAQEFTHLLARVHTFSEIKNLKGYAQYWPQIRTFLKSKMILNFQLLLSLESYELALLVCRRHRAELVLSSIPTDIPAKLLTLILVEFEKITNHKEELYTWVFDRSVEIEKLGQPKNALFLLEWAAQNLKSIENNTSPNLYVASIMEASQKRHLMNSNIMKDISKRIIQLEDIIDLASSLQTIAMSMLDRVQSPDDILPHIQSHTKPYLKKHFISLNLFLVDYVKEMVQNAEYVETRIFPILSLIECQTYRSEILIELMRRSPIPWSDNLDTLIKESLMMENKLSTDLAEQYKMMELKRMVKSYGVEKFNVADKVTALKIISLILSNESTCALQDAIMVSDVYGISRIEVFVQRLQYLISNLYNSTIQRLIKYGTEVADSPDDNKYLEQEELEYALKHVDTWILFKLDGMLSSDSQVFKSFLEAGDIISSSPVYGKTLKLCEELKRNITPKQLEDKEFTIQLLDEYIIQCGGAEGNCIRLGDLLGFEQHIILSRIARYLARKGDAKHVLSICKELVKLDVDSSSDLISALIIELIGNASKYVDQCLDISLNLLEMAKLTVRYCKPNLLEYYMTLFKRLEIAHHIILQTDLGAYKQSVESRDIDSHLDGLFEEIYHDGGLVTSSSAILPNLLTFIKTQDLKENAPSSKGKGKSSENEVYSAALNVAQECFSTRNYASCIRICQLLKMQFHNQQPSEELEQLVNDSVVSTLQNLLTTSNLDYNYSLGCMLYLPIGKANEIFKAQTPQGEEYRRSLIPYLLFKTGDITLAEDYADQFNVELDLVYKKYIQQLLFIYSDDEDRESKIVFAIEKYTNKMLLLDLLLNDYFPKLSSYDYEGNLFSKLGLLFLCQQVIYLDPTSKVAKRNKAIIEILLRYTRTSVPTEGECNSPEDVEVGLSLIERSWKTTVEVYYSQRTKRMPFHLILSDPSKILALEITESTIAKLIPLTQVLELTTDKFYEALINQKIQKLQLELKQYLSLEEYELRAISRDITFSDFKPLLSKIVDSELLVRTTVYVAGNFPRGEDRIAAYKTALQYAEKWVKSLQADNETETLEMAMTGASKIKNMLSIAETENSLQLYGLQMYDKLVTKPNSLIAQLLTHEHTRPTLEVSTYHKLAEEIARRNSIDLEKLKLMLLQKWITADVITSDLELQERVLFLFYGKLEWGVSKLYAFSQLALALICKICLDYSVYDFELWANVMESFVPAEVALKVQYAIMKEVLKRPDLSSVSKVNEVWSKVLFSSLEEWFKNECDVADLKELVDHLLQTEFLADEIIMKITEMCKSRQHTALETIASFAILHRLPNSLVAKELKHFLQWDDEQRAIETLKLLNSYGQKYAFIAEVQNQLSSLIFDMLNYRGLYLGIGKSQFMESFVKYLIRQDRITNLLSATLAASR